MNVAIFVTEITIMDINIEFYSNNNSNVNPVVR